MVIDAKKAVELLLKGDVVAVPTETVYGLAGVATLPSAIAKIFEIKNRPADNPLICHFHSIEQISGYVSDIPVATEKLIREFSPGPVSFMLDLKENSQLQFATCGSIHVIVRIPRHPVFLSIIRELDQPVAAPSANTSGKVSPTSAVMVETDIGKKISGIVDGGSSQIGLESTILDARSVDEVSILRPGAIGEKEIKKILPGSKIIYPGRGETVIPGLKYRHYAPDIQVVLINDYSEIAGQIDAVLLMTEEQLRSVPDEVKSVFSKNRIYILSLGSLSQLEELARNFYTVLSRINLLPVSRAFLLKTDFGDSSLGRALRDRIEKITGVRSEK